MTFRLVKGGVLIGHFPFVLMALKIKHNESRKFAMPTFYLAKYSISNNN